MIKVFKSRIVIYVPGNVERDDTPRRMPVPGGLQRQGRAQSSILDIVTVE